MTAIPVTTYAPLDEHDIEVLKGAPHKLADYHTLRTPFDDVVDGLVRRKYLAASSRFVGRTVMDDYTVFTLTKKGEEAIR